MKDEETSFLEFLTLVYWECKRSQPEVTFWEEAFSCLMGGDTALIQKSVSIALSKGGPFPFRLLSRYSRLTPSGMSRFNICFVCGCQATKIQYQTSSSSSHNRSIINCPRCGLIYDGNERFDEKYNKICLSYSAKKLVLTVPVCTQLVYSFSIIEDCFGVTRVVPITWSVSNLILELTFYSVPNLLRDDKVIAIFIFNGLELIILNIPCFTLFDF